MGLYPVENNWYSQSIKHIKGKDGRYFRYLKDEDARYFIRMAKNFQKYNEQIRIAKDVLHSMHVSTHIRRMVKGLMIESYIEDGAQKIGEGIYGKSITDPCLGWAKTEKLIHELANEVAAL
jgi:phospho-2-dehydro-3-deoxyheptonate aldolase